MVSPLLQTPSVPWEVFVSRHSWQVFRDS